MRIHGTTAASVYISTTTLGTKADYPSSHADRTSGTCDCGADAWNERVEATLTRYS